jgi:hypothetical protein
MKEPTPDYQNRHVLHAAKRFLLLPVTAAVALWGAVCRLFKWCKSPAERRADDQLRQSRVRRNLRGLPADHEQRPHEQS